MPISVFSLLSACAKSIPVGPLPRSKSMRQAAGLCSFARESASFTLPVSATISIPNEVSAVHKVERVKESSSTTMTPLICI